MNESEKEVSVNPCSYKRVLILWTNLPHTISCAYFPGQVMTSWMQVARVYWPHRDLLWPIMLTHWGEVSHICVSNLSTIGSDNGLSPGRRQAIIWINAGILLIGPLGINFGEILIEIHIFSFKKMHLKMSSAKWHLFHLCLNVRYWSALA